MPLNVVAKSTTGLLGLLLALAFPSSAFAATGDIDLTSSTVGYASLIIFVFAYLLVMGEEKLHLRKSKPVLVAAGLIWMMIGWEPAVARRLASLTT